MTHDPQAADSPFLAGTDGNTASFGFADIPAGEKAARVREVFDRSAKRYDLMNDLMSLGAHRAWKAAMLAWLNPQPGEILADIAGGTGDIARGFLAAALRAGKRRHDAVPAQACVIDINAEMLAAGRARGTPAGLYWICGDAERLPLPDASVHCLTIAFGIRNVTHIDRALGEMRRVLVPGGRFACLEFSKPVIGAFEAIYDRFSFDVIPRLGALAAGQRQPYEYLVQSIRRFPPQAEFAAMVRNAGFSRVRWENFSMGVAALHTGWAL